VLLLLLVVVVVVVVVVVLKLTRASAMTLASHTPDQISLSTYPPGL